MLNNKHPPFKSTSESYYLASFISLENVAEKPKILPTTNVYSGNLCYTFKKIKQKQNKIQIQEDPHQFGQLRGPCVHSNDPLPGHPVFINPAECIDSIKAFRCLLSTNQNTIWVEKVIDGCSFCQEFWVGQNLHTKNIKSLKKQTKNPQTKQIW